MRFGLLAISALLIAVFTLGASRADPPPAPADSGTVSAMDLVARTAKGDLHNPYNDTQADYRFSRGHSLPQLSL